MTDLAPRTESLDVGLPGGATAGAVPVYRVSPLAGASTTTVPAVGSVATTDAWLETTINSTTTSYFLAAKAGLVYYPPV